MSISKVPLNSSTFSPKHHSVIDKNLTVANKTKKIKTEMLTEGLLRDTCKKFMRSSQQPDEKHASFYTHTSGQNKRLSPDYLRLSRNTNEVDRMTSRTQTYVHCKS